MSKIYTSVDQLIGHTPLLELTHIEKEFALKAKLVAKLEYFNCRCTSEGFCSRGMKLSNKNIIAKKGV